MLEVQTRTAPVGEEECEAQITPKIRSKIMDALKRHFQSYSDLVHMPGQAGPAHDLPQREDL